MTQASTDQIIAHTALLRAVDRLLAQAEEVRRKREAFVRMASRPLPTADAPSSQQQSRALGGAL